jgi:hypothetical protein
MKQKLIWAAFGLFAAIFLPLTYFQHKVLLAVSSLSFGEGWGEVKKDFRCYPCRNTSPSLYF